MSTLALPDVTEFKIELNREDNGRWLAAVKSLPGVMVYAATQEEAVSRVEVLALRRIADRLERGELDKVPAAVTFGRPA